jgi:hypothetical protein
VLLRLAAAGVLLRFAEMWLLDMTENHDTVAGLFGVVGGSCAGADANAAEA